MTTESKSLAVIPENSALEIRHEFRAFSDITTFENAQRMAKILCSSNIVPEIYRGEHNLGNCVIALEMANRIGANILAVMQNLYLVHGKPAWSSQFLISCVNASGRFGSLRYRMTGTKGQDDWGCVAVATDRKGEVLESPEVTISMAKKEGWYAKNGSKWQTMPELMLRYRAATFFTRLYAPEITMGILTREEVHDAVEVESEVITSLPAFAPKPVEGGSPTEPQPAPTTPKKRGPKPQMHPPAHDTSKLEAAPITPAAPVTEPAPVEPTPVAPAEPEQSFEELVPAEPPPLIEGIAELYEAMIKCGIAEAQVIAYWNTSVNKNNPIAKLNDLPAEKVKVLTQHFNAPDKSSVVPKIKEVKV